MPLRIKPGGVVYICLPDDNFELHASTCFHCQKITEFPSMRRMHEYVDICRKCMKLICLECVGGECKPWLKQVEIDEALSRERLRRLNNGDE